MNKKKKVGFIIETFLISMIYFILLMSFFVVALFVKEYYEIYVIVVSLIVAIGTITYLKLRHS